MEYILVASYPGSSREEPGYEATYSPFFCRGGYEVTYLY